jgi:hypothetical protein
VTLPHPYPPKCKRGTGFLFILIHSSNLTFLALLVPTNIVWAQDVPTGGLTKHFHPLNCRSRFCPFCPFCLFWTSWTFYTPPTPLHFFQRPAPPRLFCECPRLWFLCYFSCPVIIFCSIVRGVGVGGLAFPLSPFRYFPCADTTS